MSEIMITKANNPILDQSALKGMFNLRYRVFRERLGWQVSCRNDMERDDFDDLNPTYIMSRNEGKHVEGCWRLLPTTGPYMLKDTFPQLLCGENVPVASDIWELSRFAVAPSKSTDTTQVTLNPVTFEMIRSVYDFARRHGIRQYVTVTSVAMERLLKKIGIPLCRFGDKKAQRVGKVLSVACKVDINEQFHAVVYPVPGEERPWQVAA